MGIPVFNWKSVDPWADTAAFQGIWSGLNCLPIIFFLCVCVGEWAGGGGGYCWIKLWTYIYHHTKYKPNPLYGQENIYDIYHHYNLHNGL